MSGSTVKHWWDSRTVYDAEGDEKRERRAMFFAALKYTISMWFLAQFGFLLEPNISRSIVWLYVIAVPLVLIVGLFRHARVDWLLRLIIAAVFIVMMVIVVFWNYNFSAWAFVAGFSRVGQPGLPFGWLIALADFVAASALYLTVIKACYKPIPSAGKAVLYVIIALITPLAFILPLGLSIAMHTNI